MVWHREEVNMTKNPKTPYITVIIMKTKLVRNASHGMLISVLVKVELLFGLPVSPSINNLKEPQLNDGRRIKRSPILSCIP